MSAKADPGYEDYQREPASPLRRRCWRMAETNEDDQRRNHDRDGAGARDGCGQRFATCFETGGITSHRESSWGRRLLKKRVQVQWPREHRKTSVRIMRPLLPGAIPIKLHAISIRIAEIQRLADPVIRCALKLDAGLDQAPQGISQLRTCRI